MRCLLISGSPEYDIPFIKEQHIKGDFVVCADVGWDYCRKAGIIPDLVVGDFDSCADADVSASVLSGSKTKVMRLNPVKDDTDTLSCIKEAQKAGCDEFLILNALGGRLDHEFSNISLLYLLEKNNIHGEIRSQEASVRVIIDSSFTFKSLKGKTFSVFPFACDSVDITYLGGVAYPLDNYHMTSDFPIGVSNVFLEDSVTVKAKNGCALVIVNM